MWEAHLIRCHCRPIPHLQPAEQSMPYNARTPAMTCGQVKEVVEELEMHAVRALGRGSDVGLLLRPCCLRTTIVLSFRDFYDRRIIVERQTTNDNVTLPTNYDCAPRRVDVL